MEYAVQHQWRRGRQGGQWEPRDAPAVSDPWVILATGKQFSSTSVSEQTIASPNSSARQRVTSGQGQSVWPTTTTVNNVRRNLLVLKTFADYRRTAKQKWPTFNHNIELSTNFQLLTDRNCRSHY